MNEIKKEIAIRTAEKFVEVDVEKYPLILGYMIGRQETVEQKAEPQDTGQNQKGAQENPLT